MRNILLSIVILGGICLFFLFGLFLTRAYYKNQSRPTLPKYIIDNRLSGYSFVITDLVALHNELMSLYVPVSFVDIYTVDTIKLQFIAVEGNDTETKRLTTGSSNDLIIPIAIDTSKFSSNQTKRNDYVEQMVLIAFYNHLMNIVEYSDAYKNFGIIIPDYERRALYSVYGKDIARRKLAFIKVQQNTNQ